MAKKEFKVPNKKQPFFKIVKKIISIFLRKPKVINLVGKLKEKSIIVSNHQGKIGPLYLDMYYPMFHVTWGAHQMLGNYKSRYNYLRNIFYIKKNKSNKFLASIRAGFESIFNIYFYKGIKVLPTYEDFRLKNTIRNSMECIKNNVSVLIFPENSNNGYFDELTEFFNGFVVLSINYYKKYNEDLPVYPSYVNSKKKVILIDKPMYVNKMLNEGLTIKEVAEQFRLKVNNLFIDYVKNEKYKAY